VRAILDHDVIIRWVSDESGVEIGDPPPGVGLERLRFDGASIVDLDALESIYVVNQSGVFQFHSVPVPQAQLVSMTYQSRKSLFDDAGVYRLKTKAELKEELKNLKNSKLKANLRLSLKQGVGDPSDQVADLNKSVSLILTYLAGGDGAAEAKAVIDAIAPEFSGIYPLAKIEVTLKKNAKILKAKMADYYNSLE